MVTGAGESVRQTMASERGAILIQVGISILVLTGLSAFVVDYGIMWLSRRQAQNAADAGALAGAVARAFDETADPPSAGGAAFQSASAAAQANAVWGTAPAATVTVAWTCPSFAAGRRCVQVNVYRNSANSNALPTIFARVFGVTSQGVQATATAVADAANASNCLMPWMVGDRFSGPDWVGPNWRFNAAMDTYVPPSAASPGTGYTIADIGTSLQLSEADPTGALKGKAYYRTDLTGDGESGYQAHISACVNVTKSISQQLTTLPGSNQPATVTGVSALISQDPTAAWDATTKSVINSCAPSTCGPVSPRLVPIALFSPAEFVSPSLDRTTGQFNLSTVNYLGFFVQTVDASGTVTGVLAARVGELVVTSPRVSPVSGMTAAPTIIR